MIKVARLLFLAGVLSVAGFLLGSQAAQAASIQCISGYDSTACSNGQCSYSYFTCTGPNPACNQNGSVYCQDASGMNYCVSSESCNPGAILQVCTPGETSSDGCGGGSCGGVKTCNSAGTGWGSCDYGSTNGNSCGSTQAGSFPSCSFSGQCSESAPSVSRTVTEYKCSSGSCNANSYTETQSCSRSTSGQSCGSVSYGGWSACASTDPSNPCSQSGSQSRTVTSPVCTNGGCSSSVTTETQSCVVNTNGNSCNDNSSCTVNDVCSNGSCNGTPNPTNGGWSGWSGWSACVNGIQTRNRSCTNPVPACGGSTCSGSNVETQTCGVCTPGETAACGAGVCGGTKTCQSDASWGACNYPGSGTSCNDGNSCTANDHCDGAGSCGGTPTSTNGGWSAWSGWSACSNGQQTRTRTCTNPAPACGGSNCSGSNLETQSCGACTPGQTRSCGGTNGQCTGVESCTAAGQWSGSCNYASSNNASCSDGNSCTTGDVCSNGSCSGVSTGNPGTWSGWSSWSSCVAGVQTRTRTCQGSNNACGSPTCTGPSVETQGCICTPGQTSTQGCGNGPCAGVKTCQNDSTWGACNVGANNGAACSDGNNCTNNDSCNNGVCVGTGNSCNVMRCGNGITEPANGEACDNGDAQNGPWPATCSSSCTVNSQPQQQDFSISVTPLTASITQGQSQSYVVIFHHTGSPQTITNIALTNCPSSATCTLSRNSVQFTTSDPAETQSVVVSITNTNSVPAGNYNLNFTGTGKQTITVNFIQFTADVQKQATAQLLVGVSVAANDAACVSLNAPASVQTGQSFAASITVRNTGLNTWQPQSVDPVTYYGLTTWPWPPSVWGGNNWNMVPASIAPGQTASFNVTMVAPSSPGSQTLSYRMLQQGVGWFGQVCSQNVTVNNSSSSCDENAVGTNKMVGCAFNTKNLSGQKGTAPDGYVAPAPVGNFMPINFDWAYGGPNGLSDNYSVRWKGRFTFEAGNYVFNTDSDDGSRIYVDGNLVVDHWSDHGIGNPKSSSPIAFAANSQHTVVYEFYENGGYSNNFLWWNKVVVPPSPTNVTGDNSVCGQVRLVWNASSGATSYNIYRNTTGNAPVAADRVGSSTTTLYTNLGVAQGLYYYWVTAVGPGGESSPTALTGSSIYVNSCKANLDTSDKDIIGVNGKTWSNADCGAYNGSPTTINYYAGDVVTFEINMCNSGSIPATNLRIVDTLSNMVRPTDVLSWNARYQDAINPSTWISITPTVSGTVPNQTLTFNFPAGYTLGTSTSGSLVRKLTFRAQLALPSPNLEFARFFNRANIYYQYTGSPGELMKTVTTPTIIFFVNKDVPNRNEIPPN